MKQVKFDDEYLDQPPSPFLNDTLRNEMNKTLFPQPQKILENIFSEVFIYKQNNFNLGENYLSSFNSTDPFLKKAQINNINILNRLNQLQ